MSVPLLELRGITHRFGTVVALDQAAIRVEAGRVHALLGENGAGKTTLMRIAFGMVSPDAGEILVHGRRVELRSPAEAIALGIGMVHQHFTLVPAMTVAENVALGGHGRLSLTREAEHVERIRESTGLHVDARRRVEQLSVAEQQRVEIMKAIRREARVLILDEPTAVLAPAEADELMAWVRRHVAAGGAVVLITHKLREALAVADDVTVLRHGRVAASGAAAGRTIEQLTDAMLGERAAGGRALPARRPATDARVVAALRDVHASQARERMAAATFEVRGGEILGVAGVEGSGHHLLLRLLAGRATADAGSVELPASIGFIPEDRHRDALLPGSTLVANVALRGAGTRSGRMRWTDWGSRARALVGAHDVRGAGDPVVTRARALSGGNQQKLVLGRELEGAPELIVAENPTRGLDVRASAAVAAALRVAADAGAAVVVHTSDLDELLALSDRVIAVHAGTVHPCPHDRAAVGRAMLGVT